MFSARAAVLSLHLPKVLCDCTRNVRMGVTIPIKKVKPLIKPKRTETYNEHEFRRVRRTNEGIAHTLFRRIESGYDDGIHEDPDEYLNTDMDAFDSEYIVDENRKLAEKDIRTRHFHSIKRKYFKEEKLPNMVTYIEKYKIKNLHREDPETWNVYKLAESFPASPAIIKKILNSTFTAYTVEAIQKHDRTVRKNWELFRKGKLSFDKELEAHYAKFAGRLRFETNVSEIKKYIPAPPDFNDQPIREFSSIIASSKKYKMLQEEKRKSEIDESGNIIHTAKNFRARVIRESMPSSTHKTHFTLDEFRKEIERDRIAPADAPIMERAPKKLLSHPSKAEGSSDIPEKPVDEQASEGCWSGAQELKHVKPETGTKKRTQNRTRISSAPDTEESVDIYKEFDYLKKETGVIGEKLPYNFAENRMDHVRMRINIPEKYWQKNKLYRIRDCFYDDQGEFLYRVPGLF